MKVMHWNDVPAAMDYQKKDLILPCTRVLHIQLQEHARSDALNIYFRLYTNQT